MVKKKHEKQRKKYLSCFLVQPPHIEYYISNMIDSLLNTIMSEKILSKSNVKVSSCVEEQLCRCDVITLFVRQQHSLWHRLGTIVMRMIVSRIGVNGYDDDCDDNTACDTDWEQWRWWSWWLWWSWQHRLGTMTRMVVMATSIAKLLMTALVTFLMFWIRKKFRCLLNNDSNDCDVEKMW